MQQTLTDEIIKIQPKGLITIPKELREELGFRENEFARIKKEKGRLIIEPVRVLPYPVRTYSHKEVDEFFKIDKEETSRLKKKGFHV